MKVQTQGQEVRVRVTRDEFTALLEGRTISDRTRWPDGRLDSVEVLGAEQSGWLRLDGGWRIGLQAQALRDLAARLPDRDGYSFEQAVPGGEPLLVSFDVDLRGWGRRSAGAGASS